jgi:adenine phosphoribosyltransferase
VPPLVTVSSVDDLRSLIREVPDFPKPGILFYDITTLLKDPRAFAEVIDRMAQPVADRQIDLVVGMESRGFIFAAPLALKLGAGFVPVRKLGKLPAETLEVEYALEYGTATLEIHRDAIQPGQKVLLVDDLLATGGTVMGTIELVERLGGEIAGLSFMVELTALDGRAKLGDRDIHALLAY